MCVCVSVWRYRNGELLVGRGSEHGYVHPTHPPKHSPPITRPRNQINQFDPHCAGEPPVATSTLHLRMNRFARGWFDLALAKVMADRSSWILRCSPHSPHLPARHRSPTQSLALALKK